MATGTVKWFKNDKGFGFIKPDDGGDDVFVHVSSLEACGLATLQENQRVQYEVVTDHKNNKLKAAQIKLLPK